MEIESGGGEMNEKEKRASVDVDVTNQLLPPPMDATMEQFGYFL